MELLKFLFGTLLFCFSLVPSALFLIFIWWMFNDPHTPCEYWICTSQAPLAGLLRIGFPLLMWLLIAGNISSWLWDLLTGKDDARKRY